MAERASTRPAAGVEETLAAAVAALGGAEREGQVRMAKAVADSMETGEHLLVQAGTGTGKSLAYLQRNEKRQCRSGDTWRDRVMNVEGKVVVPLENDLVLDLVQAMLGNVSPSLVALAVARSDEEVVLHALSKGAYASIEEDLEDIVAEFEGLLWPLAPPLTVHHSHDAANWPGRAHRLVYYAKTAE